METTENNILANIQMLEHTNAYLDDHISIWTAIPIVSSYKNRMHELTLSIKAVSSKDDISAESYSGQDVLQLKQQIADKMDILDDTLEAYAEDIGNDELKKLAANYYSDYYALTFDNFQNKVIEMIDLLEEHVGDMADYGLVQDQINDVKLNLDEYQIALDKPITYNLNSSLTSQSIENLLSEAQQYARKLDSVMKRFKRSNFTFYNGYLSARTMSENVVELAY